MSQIDFEGIEFPTADEAIQHTNASGLGVAITVSGKNLVVSEATAQRLEVARVQFAYLHEHQERIVTVPVNGPLAVRLKEPVKGQA